MAAGKSGGSGSFGARNSPRTAPAYLRGGVVPQGRVPRPLADDHDPLYFRLQLGQGQALLGSLAILQNHMGGLAFLASFAGALAAVLGVDRAAPVLQGDHHLGRFLPCYRPHHPEQVLLQAALAAFRGGRFRRGGLCLRPAAPVQRGQVDQHNA